MTQKKEAMPAKRHSKPYLHFVIGGILILGFASWLLYAQREAIAGVWRLLPLFSLPCVIMVLVLDCLQILFMSMRFWSLFPKSSRAPLPVVFSAISIGQTMNSFLPARAGDFYKIAVLSPKTANQENSVFTLTGIFTADKLIDLVAFASMILCLGSYRYSFPKGEGSSFSLQYWWLLVFPLLALFWQFYLKKNWDRFRLWLLQFARGFQGMLNPRQALQCFVLAVIVWTTEAIAIQVLAHYQGFQLSFSQSIYVLTVLNLALSIPISIANIGPFEASLAFAFTTLKFPMDKAIAIATVHHGLQMLAYVLCGGMGWGIKRWSRASS